MSKARVDCLLSGSVNDGENTRRRARPSGVHSNLVGYVMRRSFFEMSDLIRSIDYE